MSVERVCKECGKAAAAGARRCDCGSASFEVRKDGRLTNSTTGQLLRGVVCCGESGCTQDAMTKVKVKTGWLPLCREHFDARFLGKVRRYTDGKGWTNVSMDPQQRAQACRVAVKELDRSLHLFDFGDTNPKSWAYEIIRQNESGREFPIAALENARQVVREDQSPEDMSIYGQPE